MATSTIPFLNTLPNVVYVDRLSATENTTLTLIVPNGYRGLFFILDSASSRNGGYHLWANASGSVGTRAITAADAVTIDVATTNRLKITSTSGMRFLLFISVNLRISQV